ncbi:P-loop containing nucleoside triphosphate hydrolase protein [Schizopora paradoxa]|uniref:p-loop containing nucleoside triphosphate hydrolase protein n=1 Tax=Schizopora paradoxa TaxID=27342 RepID=A0A0H2RXQ3_9AGAM|nr:P-loop containing nucleoside triphosphate hydrolase protein [Schizopora paradoxa]
MAKNNVKKHVPSKTKLKKDPGIPKLPDLKQRKSIQQQKAIKKVAFPGHADADAVMAAEPTLSSLALLAAEAQAQEASSSNLGESPSSGVNGSVQAQQRRYYIRTLHKVIDEADIVILVLDARDPEGCRSRLVEEEVRRREHEGKKLVFVLNKVDLIPRANAEAWLRHLRHTAPTLPFKSSTQQQRTNLTSHTSPALLNLLKAYRRPTGAKTSITVGVVGYPNVGKSSLINSLKRAKVCGVAAEAGYTKDMQCVQVERGVRVLDSPGVVFDDESAEAAAGSMLLRNVLKVEDIPDPIAVVEQILVKTEHSKLQEIYSIPQFNSTLEFLTMIALSAGRLHKGGTPDILAAARQVIQDWNAQKIPYFSVPPSVHSSSVPVTLSDSTIAKYGIEGNVAPGAENIGAAAIVTEFAPAFDLGNLFSQADSGAFNGSSGDCDMQDGHEDDQS